MRIEETIGYRMAQYRTAAGLSQADLGKLLSDQLGKPWHRQSVWAAERGQRSFTAAELVALVEVLSIPGLDALFGRGTAATPVVHEVRGTLDLSDPESLEAWAQNVAAFSRGLTEAIERIGRPA